MPVSVFQLAFDVMRKLNPTYPVSVSSVDRADETEKRHVSKATPQTTHLFISLVHSFVALPLICFFFFIIISVGFFCISVKQSFA